MRGQPSAFGFQVAVFSQFQVAMILRYDRLTRDR